MNKLIVNFIGTIVLVSIFKFVGCDTAPHWQELECELEYGNKSKSPSLGNVSSSLLFICSQPRHKYLFSDVPRTWQDAREECELYGGWLLNIGGVEEHNCIVRYGRSQGYDAWYLTDGMLVCTM